MPEDFFGHRNSATPRKRLEKSLLLRQKIRQVETCRIFLSKPQAWHIITTQSCISSRAHCALVSYHAPACISLRLDDMQHFVLITYRRQAADDIHAFGVILRVAFLFAFLFLNRINDGNE